MCLVLAAVLGPRTQSARVSLPPGRDLKCRERGTPPASAPPRSPRHTQEGSLGWGLERRKIGSAFTSWATGKGVGGLRWPDPKKVMVAQTGLALNRDSVFPS